MPGPRIELAQLAPQGSQARKGGNPNSRPTASGFNRSHVGTNSLQLGPSWDQTPHLYGLIRWVEQRKGNRIIRIYGAGDVNRTNVRSLGGHQLSDPALFRQSCGVHLPRAPIA